MHEYKTLAYVAYCTCGQWISKLITEHPSDTEAEYVTHLKTLNPGPTTPASPRCPTCGHTAYATSHITFGDTPTIICDQCGTNYTPT